VFPVLVLHVSSFPQMRFSDVAIANEIYPVDQSDTGHGLSSQAVQGLAGLQMLTQEDFRRLKLLSFL
jgi:hypothetical protein